MSKSSQRKRSMYQLGKRNGSYYLNPIYPKSKDYMRGWNETYEKGVTIYIGYDNYYKKLTLRRTLIFILVVTVTITIGAVLL